MTESQKSEPTSEPSETSPEQPRQLSPEQKALVVLDNAAAKACLDRMNTLNTINATELIAEFIQLHQKCIPMAAAAEEEDDD